MSLSYHLRVLETLFQPTGFKKISRNKKEDHIFSFIKKIPAQLTEFSIGLNEIMSCYF